MLGKRLIGLKWGALELCSVDLLWDVGVVAKGQQKTLIGRLISLQKLACAHISECSGAPLQ